MPHYAEILHAMQEDSIQESCIARRKQYARIYGMTEDDYKKLVGFRLRQAIEAVGITFAEAARNMGISQQKLGNWMRGDNYPDPYSFRKLHKRRKITADWIYLGEVSGMPKDAADALLAAEEASSEELSAVERPAHEGGR